ncbi:MAG: phage major capsid protein, partial [Alphaproteobacteria bacterium]
MRAMADTPEDGGDLSDDQEARFSELKNELEALEKKIERQRFLDDAERRMNGETITGSGDDRLDAAARDFSLRRAILSQMPGHSEDCGREIELSAEFARRSGRKFEGMCVPLSVFHEPFER